MGHEARMDARGEYDAEISAEARREFEGELPGIIAGAIEAGEYDAEACARVADLCDKQGMANMSGILRRWAEKLAA